MTSPDLKPCPFCGSEAEKIIRRPVENGLPEYIIRCTGIRCGAEVVGWMVDVTAIKAWNTREDNK